MAKKRIKEAEVKETKPVEDNPQEVVQSENSEEVKTEEKPKSKRQLRKEKRVNKLRSYLIESPDIKFRGPLSYRYLRAIGWLALVLAQLIGIDALCKKLINFSFLGEVGSQIITTVSGLTMPLFLIAAFSIIFNRNRTWKSMIIFYGIAFLGFAGAFYFVVYRYVVSLFTLFEMQDMASLMLSLFFSSEGVMLNIFTDLFMLTLFNFFINYRPKKFFKGRKIRLFRALCALPIIYVVICYFLRVITFVAKVPLPIFIYPLLTTKSPAMHIIFIILSLWFKHRERLFKRLGGSHEQYEVYLKSNKSSLSFSLTVSILFTIFSFVDFIMFVIVGIIVIDKTIPIADALPAATDVVHNLGIGDCVSLWFAVPFVMLFSYTRMHKNKSIDVVIPLTGIGLIVLVYIEAFYQIVYNYLGTLATQ